MKYRHVILLSAILIAVSSGCTNPTATNAVRRLNGEAERTGSPYRYRAYSVAGGSMIEKYRIAPPVPAPIPVGLQPSSANAELLKDVLVKIAAIEQGWGGTGSPSLAGVQRSVASGGSIKEIWFVRKGDGAIRYEVSLAPSAQGGTDFSVAGPLD